MYLHLKWLHQIVLHTVWRGMQISVGTYNCALKRNLTVRRKKSGGSEKVLFSYLRKVHFPTREVTFLRSLALWARPQLREGKFFEWGLSEVFKQYSWAPLYGHPFNMDTFFFFPLFMTLPPASKVNACLASQNLPPPTSLHFLIYLFWLTNIFILGSHWQTN